jgi:hypothetical protein
MFNLFSCSRMFKKYKDRLVPRAARNAAHVFAATYRGETVGERPLEPLLSHGKV